MVYLLLSNNMCRWAVPLKHILSQVLLLVIYNDANGLDNSLGNSILYDIAQGQLQRSQMTQNTAARIITNTSPSSTSLVAHPGADWVQGVVLDIQGSSYNGSIISNSVPVSDNCTQAIKV